MLNSIERAKSIETIVAYHYELRRSLKLADPNCLIHTGLETIPFSFLIKRVYDGFYYAPYKQ